MSSVFAYRGIRTAVGMIMMSAAVWVDPHSAFAAAATEPEATDSLQEIVVTAQFREEKLQDTPLAITAVSGETMRARGQENIIDMTDQAPNVDLKLNGGPLGASVSAYIRGIGQGDFNFALEPGVGMYIDDVYFSTLTGSAFQLLDLERVEVLRGPQGTLEGRNAIGGAIRMVTKKPTGDDTGSVELITGEFNRVGVKAAADLKLTDTLFLRITGASNTQNGYVTREDFACARPAIAAQLGIPSNSNGSSNCKLGTLGGQSYTGGRVDLRWMPVDGLEVNVIGDLTNDKDEATADVLVEAPPSKVIGRTSATSPIVYGPWFVPNGHFISYETFTDPRSPVTGAPFTVPPINNDQTKGAAVVVDYKINDKMAIKSITSRRNLTNDFATASDGSPLGADNGEFELTGRSFQEELRLNGTEGPFDYTLGAFYFTSHNVSDERIDINYIAINFPEDFIGRDITDTKSKAAFLHTVWHMTDRFNLTTGLRYSNESKPEQFGRLNPIDGGITPSTLSTFASLVPNGGYTPVTTYHNSRTDYRVSLDYRWNDHVMSYATTSTGFKAGGVSPRFFFASQILPFKPETVTAYEAGLKTDWFDDKLRINIAGFLNNYKDQQGGAPGGVCPGLTPPTPCLAIFNATDSRVTGVEWEMFYQPLPGTLFNLSASEVGNHFTRVSPVTLAQATFNRDAPAPFGVPHYKISTGLQQTVRVPQTGGSLLGRVDFTYEAKAESNDVFSLPITPAYGVANARLSYDTENDKWETSVELKNLANRYYYINIMDNSATNGWADAQPAPPRTWMLSVRRNFN